MALLLTHAAQLVTCSEDAVPVCGKRMDRVTIIEDASVLVDADGSIVAVGATEQVELVIKEQQIELTQTIDARGLCILPGLVDAHTHPVWAGDRVHEFGMKLRGATYMEVHAAGGGIGFTVSKTREASEEELFHSLVQRIHRMASLGTTLLEGKSGYGLETATELKMLRVLSRAGKLGLVDIVSSYCGAHSLNPGESSAQATERILSQELPAILESQHKGEIDVSLIDVFCEKGVFSTEDSKKILIAGKEKGLKVNFHGDELNPTGSAEMAGEIQAIAVSHLECVSADGIKALAEKKILAVMLPTTALILNLKHPPIRTMIDSGVPIALGTDFNPNAYCLSMPMAMFLACTMFRMTPEESFVAATINSAASMGKAETHGSLTKGKRADLILLAAPRWEHIIYQVSDPPIAAVFKSGRIVFQAPYFDMNSRLA
jgi:imidazolonepropionase